MNSKTQSSLLASGIGFALVGVVLMVSSNAPVNAEDTDFNQRFYGGIGIGGSLLNPDTRTDFMTVGEENDMAANLSLGMDLTRRFSIEGYYTRLGNAGIDFMGDSVGDISYDMLGLSGVGYLFGRDLSSGEDSLSQRTGLSGFVKFGVGMMENSSELQFTQDYKYHVSVGLGLEYGWRNGFALRTEVLSFDADAQYAGLSLIKRFGRAAPATTRPVEPAPQPVAPEPVKPEPPKPIVVEIPTIYFAFSRYELVAEEQDKLRIFAQALKQDAALAVQLDGHTDWIDTEAYNMNLSRQRADAVRDFLLAQGVDADRVKVSWHGESLPVRTNITDEGRAYNRRVEISLQ